MLLQNVPVETKRVFFQNSHFFSGFSADVLRELERGSFVRKYAANESILVEGDHCDGLYNLISGSIKLFKISPSGRELIITVFEEGVTFNEVPVFDGGNNPINVAALEESTLLILPRDVLYNAIRKHPEQCQIVIERLAENLRHLVELIEELAFFQIPNRLARLLLRLPANRTFTQEQLAARLGTVREVISRAMHELEQSGAIRYHQRKVEILDRPLLEQWANQPDPIRES